MLDIDEIIVSGPLLIEWAERIEDILPQKRLWIELEHLDEEQRRLQLKATGERYQAFIASLQQSAFGGG